MFSDIRDFTAMSEKMYINDLMQFLNTYLAFALPPITEFGGFVDKFIGDSIMCIFAHSDLCEQATGQYPTFHMCNMHIH
jgi:class 3 adenylate cyclase